jgi:enoyl-CoA hydratase/carnithine racemase
MFELETDGPVATLRLRRPEARNAIPVDGWAALADRAEEAEQNGARLLLLAGEPGGAFCAGADLAGFEGLQGDPVAGGRFRTAMRGGLDRLRDLPIPTAALIEGACYGAGVALAMACDLRLASAGARFGITPAKLGIGYPQEDVHRLVGLVGAGQAARLLFSAGTIDAAEAHRIGLVELIAEPEGAAAMLASIAAMEPGSLRMLKRGIGLAAAGIVSDEEQDRRFDELLASDVLAARLAARRRG